MKVKDLILTLQCVNEEADLQVIDGWIVVSKDDGEHTLEIDPLSGDIKAGSLLGMIITMAFSARDNSGETDGT